MIALKLNSVIRSPPMRTLCFCSLRRVLIATFSAASLASASAGIFTFEAALTGGAEVPSNGSTATGSATLTIDDVAMTYSLSGSFAGLTANASAAHIHRAAVGVAGPVVYGLTISAATSGSLSGSGSLETKNLAFDSSYTPAEQIAELQAGLWYVNVHNAPFPGGEIRGQLTAVPEPGTYAIAFGAGLLGFALWRRRG